MIIGVDACNIRQGGGLVHLRELLNESNPQKHNFTKIIVWSNTNTLNALPDFSWIEKKTNPYLEKSFIWSFFYQFFYFSKELARNSCDIVLVPGGTFLSNFRPFVAISQNMLPFELTEAFRYTKLTQRIKFLFLRFTQSVTFKNATGLIFLTNYAKLIISKVVHISENNIIIPHGINKLQSLVPKEQKEVSFYNRENPFNILYVSILSPYKHQPLIAKAVCDIYKLGYPIKLTLIGPYEQETFFELNKVLNNEPVSKFCINYLGAVPHSDLFEYYKNSDSFIFASTCENLPIILIEAMSSGLPILSSCYGPMREVLGQNGGLYFDPLNPTELKNKIIEFFNNPITRENAANESFIKSIKYTWSDMADSTFKFLYKTKISYYVRR